MVFGMTTHPTDKLVQYSNVEIVTKASNIKIRKIGNWLWSNVKSKFCEKFQLSFCMDVSGEKS